MENLNELKIKELENTISSLDYKIFNVKESISKNIEILKKHHQSHLEMIKENPDSDYLKGLASNSKFQLEIAEMNEHHILQILLYF